jgi:hypothetical protein
MSDTDFNATSSSESDSESDLYAPVKDALRRSYFKFAVSQDPHNQSFLGPSQFAQLDLYQIDALRDDDDPLGIAREMQGATHHFPCHVFWSRELGSGKYAVWGRATVDQHEQEAVIKMLEAQRREREEYRRMAAEQKWQRACERKIQADRLERSAALAARRADARRAYDAAAAEAAEPLVESAPVGRIASIVHRIVRRAGDASLSETQAASMVNHGLKRLGLKALAAGSIALVSAVMYLQQLQSQASGDGANDDALSALQLPPNDAPIAPAPQGWGSGGFPYMHAGGGGFPAARPILAARIDDPTTRVTDRVFAAHDRRRRCADQK